MTTLDTHQIVEDLPAAGMPKEQAEAVMRAVRTREDFAFAQLATKADLADLGREFQSEIQGLHGEIHGLQSEIHGVQGEIKSTRQDLKDNYATKYDVSRVETRLVMWVVGTAIALFGLLKVFP